MNNGYGYGQTAVELETLKGMTPEERQALVRGEYVPDRMQEFQRSRSAQEQMLRNQIDRAYQVANSPMEVHGGTPAAGVASIIANALRTFGGFALASKQERALDAARAESQQQYEGLMGDAEKAAGIGLTTKERGLSGALRNYPGYDDPTQAQTPYYLRAGQ